MFIRLSLILFFAVMTAFSQSPPIGPGVSHDLAIWRAAHYSDVRYKLNLTLEKMSPVLKGTIEIRVTVDGEKGRKGEGEAALPGTQAPSPANAGSSGVTTPIILDWRMITGHEKDSTISNVTINGSELRLKPRESITPEGVTLNYEESNDHLIFRDGVVAGENVIKLDFTSPILTSGSAITRYVDKEDGAEYIYSLFVPSDASTAFPVFDQPDLKARFSLEIATPNGWSVVTNTSSRVLYPYLSNPNNQSFTNYFTLNHAFEETKPISTYVFAFAAGPFQEFTDEGSKGGNLSGSEGAQRGTPSDSRTLPTGRVSASGAGLSSHIYVRRSQAAKFKPHAAEVFRLTREGIKYLETYFDYKFPFPKYDIVLIPEFPFGGMEHAGATFLKESSVIFPQEPTKGDYISRANLIFHETAHQWFGDTVTMKWFDDLWLKEGFAEFMAYKTLEHVMPDANAWKVFYERNKQAAYATDSTKGTTPIYQKIDNLSAAKSAYGNIVYRKAPSFLRQAEFYLGEDKFQTAVRTFLKKHEFANAGWEDLVKEFEGASGRELEVWADSWVTKRGMPIIAKRSVKGWEEVHGCCFYSFYQTSLLVDDTRWREKLKFIRIVANSQTDVEESRIIFNLESIGPLTSIVSSQDGSGSVPFIAESIKESSHQSPFFELAPKGTYFVYLLNYGDYGYGIFLLDDKSRDYVLKNIQNEKDPFLRSMMFGSLWDSVREGELDPKEYVELVVKNLSSPPCLGGVPEGRGGSSDKSSSASPCGQGSFSRTTTPSAETAATPPKQGGEQDETIVATLLGRVSTALNYYMSEPPATAGGSDLRTRLEDVLIERMQNAPTLGQRITFYRAFLNIAASGHARSVLKQMLKSVPPAVAGGVSAPATKAPPATAGGTDISGAIPLRTKDRFDIVTRLIVLGDPDAEKLLADLEKTETTDDAKRYAYAARAAFATKENREKFWNDFVNNKDISESWIEAAFVTFNSIRHDDLSLPYLQRALAELPNLKRNRKIFFVNGWLGAFIGGQRSKEALDIVNKFLADNPKLDNDLRLKILENVDLIERAVKIRAKYGKK